MAGKPYVAPANIDRSQVINLMPEHARGAEMKPTTPVICSNRGPTRIVDKYDGEDYDIPPYALFEVTYGAALHLQRRAIVPGTRNPDMNDPSRPSMISWVGIHGVDSAEACEPFTEAQLAYINGGNGEGLARHMLPSPVDRQAVVKTTAELSRLIPGMGLVGSAQAMAVMHGGTIGVDQGVIGGSDEMRDAALEPVIGSEARREEQELRGRGFENPSEHQLSERSDETPRQRDAAPPAPAIGKKKR